MTPADGHTPNYRIQRNGRDLPEPELRCRWRSPSAASSATTSSWCGTDGTRRLRPERRRAAVRHPRPGLWLRQRVRRSHRSQAGRNRAARGRSPEGRVPRHALARTAQPAGADPQCARSDAPRARQAGRGREGALDHGAAAAASGADHRRSARRGADHAEQAGDAPRVDRPAGASCRARSRRRVRRSTARGMRWSCTCRRRRSGPTPTRRGWRRCSRISSTTPSNTPARGGRIRVTRRRRRGTGQPDRGGYRRRDSRRRCCRSSSTCSRSFPATAIAATAGWASA